MCVKERGVKGRERESNAQKSSSACTHTLIRKVNKFRCRSKNAMSRSQRREGSRGGGEKGAKCIHVLDDGKLSLF